MPNNFYPSPSPVPIDRYAIRPPRLPGVVNDDQVICASVVPDCQRLGRPTHFKIAKIVDQSLAFFDGHALEAQRGAMPDS